jgi:hypothetical protein
MSPRPEKLEPRGEVAVGPDVGRRRKFGAPFLGSSKGRALAHGYSLYSIADYLDGLDGLVGLECLDGLVGLECLES